MQRPVKWIVAIARCVHNHLLWFVIGSYALAAVLPQPGLRLRDWSLGDLALGELHVKLSSSALLLAALLLIAGLGARFEQLRGMARRPLPLLVGLMGNLLVPLVFVLCIALILRLWPDRLEAQNCLLGL